MAETLEQILAQTRAAGVPDEFVYQKLLGLSGVEQAQPAAAPRKEGFFVRNLPTIASLAAGIPATIFTGGLGGAAGFGAGAGVGKAIQQKLRGEPLQAGPIGREAATSFLIGRLFPGGVAAKGAAQVAGKAGVQAAGQVAKKSIAQRTAERAAGSFLKPSGALTTETLEAGVSLREVFTKWARQLGGNVQQMIGGTAERGMGGNVGKLIGTAEQQIDDVLRAAPKTYRIPGKEVADVLRARAKDEAAKLGGGARAAQLNKLAAEAARKTYTASSAREIVKNANRTFGKAQTLTGKEAILRQAQVEEGNIVRGILRRDFPEVATQLNNERELIFLRKAITDVLEGTERAGLGFGRLDLSRPLQLAEGLLSQPQVATMFARAASLTGTQREAMLRELVNVATRQVVGQTTARGFTGGGLPQLAP